MTFIKENGQSVCKILNSVQVTTWNNKGFAYIMPMLSFWEAESLFAIGISYTWGCDPVSIQVLLVSSITFIYTYNMK